MDSPTAVLPRQSCVCPCLRTSLPYLGRTDYARLRTDSNSFAGSRHGHEVDSSLKSAISRERPTAATRCLYSPLVESFEAPKDKTFVAKLDSSNGSRTRVSPASLSAMRPAKAEGVLEEDVMHRESTHTFVSDVEAGELEGEVDDTVPAPRDPVAAPHDDSNLLAKASDAGHDLEARKIARYREPQTMSLTQVFRSNAQKGVNATIGAAGKGAITKASKIGGPAGLLVGLAVAGLGIATAFQKASETQTPQKVCSRCDGYGVECCGVCSGAGQISWEGKAHRKNLCPRCFGSCLTKCPRCDGMRVKKESTPVLQQLKTPQSKGPSNSSSKTPQSKGPSNSSSKSSSKTLPRK